MTHSEFAGVHERSALRNTAQEVGQAQREGSGGQHIASSGELGPCWLLPVNSPQVVAKLYDYNLQEDHGMVCGEMLQTQLRLGMGKMCLSQCKNYCAKG